MLYVRNIRTDLLYIDIFDMKIKLFKHQIRLVLVFATLQGETALVAALCYISLHTYWLQDDVESFIPKGRTR